MSTNRLLTGLVSTTLILQFVILYRQGRGPITGGTASAVSATSSPTRQAPIVDLPREAFLDLAGLPIEGNSGSKTILVEFSDYECPFCIRHTSTVAGTIEKEFIKSGKIRHVFLNNPLPIHPHARILAMAAICAGDQNHYWEMHDALFKDKPRDGEAIVAAAVRLGLNTGKFQACMERNPDGDKRIEDDMQRARDLNISFTPGFAVGRVDSQGRVRLTKLIVGAQPFSVFEKEINDVLSPNHGADLRY